jgi:GH15 family glucan-1,4-alpha-glucosidase
LHKLNIKAREEILDIDGSNSSFPLFLANKGARVTTLDIAAEKMQYVHKYAKKLKSDFLHKKGAKGTLLKNVVVVGNYYHSKGIDLMLSIVEDLSDIEWFR